MNRKPDHILVADDDPVVIKLIEQSLTASGCVVTSVDNGVSALSELVNNDVDVVVTDITMPSMNGLELIRSIKKLNLTVPILILTNDADFSTVMDGIKLGALDYIVKDQSAAERVVYAVAKALRYNQMVEANQELNHVLTQRNKELESMDRHNRRLLERFMLLNEDLSGKMDEASIELGQRLAEITALNEVAHAIGSVLELDQVLKMTMQKSKEVMKAEASSLILLDEDLKSLMFYVATGKYGEELAKLELEKNKGFAGWVTQHGKPLIIEDAYEDERFNPDYDEKTGFRTRSVLCVPLEMGNKIIGVAQVLNPKDKEAFVLKDLQTFSIFAGQASIAIQNARLLEGARTVAEELRDALERERWLTVQRNKLGMYVSKSALEKITTEREDVLASPTQKVNATVLFSDIKGFTSISETTDPEDLVEGLNEYHSVMHEVIEKHHGVIDKFIGDGIMCVFLPQDDFEPDALRAVSCALEMIEQLERIRLSWTAHGLGELKVRIGVQSGEMVSGSVGAKRRRDYTVLGDPVNVASRLEGRAPDDGILIGDSTYKVVADSVHVERLDPMQLRNRKERVVPYRVLGRTNDQS